MGLPNPMTEISDHESTCLGDAIQIRTPLFSQWLFAKLQFIAIPEESKRNLIFAVEFFIFLLCTGVYLTFLFALELIGTIYVFTTKLTPYPNVLKIINQELPLRKLRNLKPVRSYRNTPYSTYSLNTYYIFWFYIVLHIPTRMFQQIRCCCKIWALMCYKMMQTPNIKTTKATMNKVWSEANHIFNNPCSHRQPTSNSNHCHKF